MRWGIRGRGGCGGWGVGDWGRVLVGGGGGRGGREGAEGGGGVWRRGRW